MLPGCCDPDQQAKSLVKWGVERPNEWTLKTGWNEHYTARPAIVIPIQVPDGYLMAYPTKRGVTPGPTLDGFDAYIVPGGAGVFLPGAGNWHIYYSGATAVRAVKIDASHPVAAAMLNCGDGAYAVPTHSTASVDNASGATVRMPANMRTVYRFFQNNDSSLTLWLMLGATAVANQGIKLLPGDSYEMSKKNGNLYRGAVHAIASAAGPAVLLMLEGGIPVPS